MAKWEVIAAQKRKQLAETIPSEWRIPSDGLPPESQDNVLDWPEQSGFFTPRELEITGLTASELLPRLASGEWKSEEVTRAFCKRAAVGQQLLDKLNCLSETLFDRAIETAKSLDRKLETSGPAGPLHGLPVSLKDNFEITGLDTTVGFTSFVGQPAKHDAAMVDILLSLGAVLYVKTNVPTAMMIPETVNNVFGRTVNPRNRKLTSGGSSGGESALIAFKGSPLGVGTDIGGSLRIPSAMTGILTLKPSHGRFPTLGAKPGLRGQETVKSINGPMARILDDLEAWAMAVVGTEPWKVDPMCLPIPWRRVELPARLKIGVLWKDGIVTPTPPIVRALQHTVEKLRAAGHEMIDWSPDLHGPILQDLGKFFTADGGKMLEEILEKTGEPSRPELSMYQEASEMGVSDLWQRQYRRGGYVARYLEQWQAAGIDAILAPVAPYAAVEHTKYKYVGYTGVFNVVDYAATTFPSGLYVEQELDKAVDYATASELDKTAKQDYNVSAIHGQPINLQLVGQRLEEEKVLAMTRRILEAL